MLDIYQYALDYAGIIYSSLALSQSSNEKEEEHEDASFSLSDKLVKLLQLAGSEEATIFFAPLHP